VDGGGLAALFTDALDVLFSDADLPADPPEVTALPPLAQAAWQSGPAGRRQNLATQRHWKRQLARVPARRFADTDDERQPRHWQVRCHSAAAYLATRSIAARTGTETSPVLMAAVAVAFATATGGNPAVLQVVVNNRFRPGLADTVSPIAQTGLCVIDVADITFDQVVDRARQSATSAYLNAYYHPDEMTELIAELGRERGEEIDLRCFLNDRRSQESRESAGPVPTQTQIRAALNDTTLDWGPHSDTEFAPFFCHFDNAPDAVSLLAQSDTRCLPPDGLAAFLNAFESILVRAAFDPAASTGVGSALSVG
jgi:Condensation domain